MIVQVGTHHAREWPANESTLEWGYELIKNSRATPLQPALEPELDTVVNDSRSFVIPVMNVDGFDATIESEGRNPDGSYEDPVDSGGEPGRDTSGDQARARAPTSARTARIPTRRRRCPASPARATTSARPDGHGERPADRGVDPNRNYGVEWGGPGTSSRVDGPHLPRPGAVVGAGDAGVRDFLRDLQPAVLITNHTFTGLMLRPPGTSDFGPVPDEKRLRRLGDEMAARRTTSRSTRTSSTTPPGPPTTTSTTAWAAFSYTAGDRQGRVPPGVRRASSRSTTAGSPRTPTATRRRRSWAACARPTPARPWRRRDRARGRRRAGRSTASSRARRRPAGPCGSGRRSPTRPAAGRTTTAR